MNITKMKVTNIAIIGMGLIGGSIGMALKNASKFKYRIIGIGNNSDTLRQAVLVGAADCVTTDFAKGVSEADIIFICTPVLQIVPVVKKILPFLKAGAILTDAGSTKGYVAKQITGILPSNICYVAGHPMAGREQSGIMAADKDLFRNKWYIVIPEVSTSPRAVEAVCQIIKDTGARITAMDVVSHDRCAAIISHIPHIAAAAMVNLLDAYPNPEDSLKLAGGGFRDTTRIASSNADMWADICLTNADSITNGLENLRSILDQVINSIKEGDRQALYAYFHAAKTRRDALITASGVNSQ